MIEKRISRRRVIAIVAAVAAMGVGDQSPSLEGSAPSYEWKGQALGADARIVLLGSNRGSAEAAIAMCRSEIERLESIFSLHRTDSALVELNHAGFLESCAIEFRELLRQCRHIHAISDGLFDPTVQPLWQASARWYSEHPTQAMPDRMSEDMRRLIGFDQIQLHGERILMPHGTEITLNGIAQGYITDKVAALLCQAGWQDVLVDVGEVYALGVNAAGTPFEIEVRESGVRIPMRDRALATSSPDGLLFSPASGVSHILHPRDPYFRSPWRSITVTHPSASVADGLSTALTLASADEIAVIASRAGEGCIWATLRNGTTRVFGPSGSI